MGPEFTHFLDSLGWTVLHSLWQGGLAFICVVALRFVFRNGSPAVRYMAQMSVLIVCLAAFFVTFFLHLGTMDVGTSAPAIRDGHMTFGGFIRVFEPGQTASAYGLPDISHITPLIALLWAIGFMGLSLRYAFTYGQVQQLRVLGVSDAPLQWKLRFLKLAEMSGIGRTVKLQISQHIDGPMTMGFLKPIVLVPTGFLTGLPADQVEAVLLHELAHIRRHDYALNLVQTGVKTVLFYHPAIHIISRWVDRDREQACDDMAVSRGQNPGALVRGLAALRLKNASLAMSATGEGRESPLMARLTRLTGQGELRPKRPEHMLMSLLSALMIGTVYVGATSKADAHPPEPDTRVRSLADVETPASPVLPDTIIPASAIRPAPPQPPVFPPLDLPAVVDKNVFQNQMKADGALWGAYALSLHHYERSLEAYIETASLSEDEMEALVEDYEDRVESVEDAFESRREILEDRYEDYVELQHESGASEAEHHHVVDMSNLELQIEQAVEISLETVERTIERVIDNTEREIEIQVRRAEAQARQYSKSAEKHVEKAEKYAVKNEKRREAHEAFRDSVMQALLDDGLIASMHETVRLSHPGNVMSLNGTPMPKAFRDKYCDMWDAAGFIDDQSEITITPDRLTILTDFEDGRHKTRVTYGTWEE